MSLTDLKYVTKERDALKAKNVVLLDLAANENGRADRLEAENAALLEMLGKCLIGLREADCLSSSDYFSGILQDAEGVLAKHHRKSSEECLSPPMTPLEDMPQPFEVNFDKDGLTDFFNRIEKEYKKKGGKGDE